MNTILGRELATERAILITASQAHGSGCVEEFSLYNAATICLEASSTMLVLARNCNEPHFENTNHSSLRTQCMTEAWKAPHSLNELRKAVADALRLARKELKDEFANKI